MSPGDEVVRIASALDVAHGSVDVTAAIRSRRGTGEHRVDRGGDELDVPELLGSDVRDEVVEGPGALLVAEVERLERVVHEGGHLAEAAAHQLLNGCGAVRIRIGRRRKLRAPTVDAQNHGGPPGRAG